MIKTGIKAGNLIKLKENYRLRFYTPPKENRIEGDEYIKPGHVVMRMKMYDFDCPPVMYLGQEFEGCHFVLHEGKKWWLPDEITVHRSLKERQVTTKKFFAELFEVVG